MDWYRIPFHCPDCKRMPRITDLAINAEWKLGINYTCNCGREGGQQFELIELVQGAQKSDEVQFQ